MGHGADTAGLTFVEAELTRDAGWAEAVAGCEFVLHMASPFPVKAPRDENELIVPAREGTVRVLRAAREAGVKRVVVTSSFAAIGYGHAPRVEAGRVVANGHRCDRKPRHEVLSDSVA